MTVLTKNLLVKSSVASIAAILIGTLVYINETTPYKGHSPLDAQKNSEKTYKLVNQTKEFVRKNISENYFKELDKKITSKNNYIIDQFVAWENLADSINLNQALKIRK